MEIDFSPLPETLGKGKYMVHLVIHARNEVTYKDSFTVMGNLPVSLLRDSVKTSMESVPGWKVKAVGDHKLIIEGHRDSPVRSVDIKVEGLPPEKTPKVLRIKEIG